MAANVYSTHGVWNAACRFLPASPAITPAIVKITAFAKIYTVDKTIARRVEILSPAPAMMPDRIGIIGNTHGVNASPSPARKNAPNTSHNEPLSAFLKLLSLFSGAAAFALV